jgi:hypothetical protein
MKGYAHLALVLVLLQSAGTVLAMLGQLLVNGGNPLYVPVAAAHVIVLLVAVVHLGQRWAAVTVIIVQGLSFFGFWVSLALGLLLPWIAYPANLVGLLTNLMLPAALLYLAARTLFDGRAAVSS